LCFGAFKNESSALQRAINKNPGWQEIRVNLQDLEGLDWRSVFDPAIRSLPGFLWKTYKVAGWVGMRDFAYPFIGYLVFVHLRFEFHNLPSKPRIVTTNLMHPLSVGIHLAARDAGLSTIFWEHAMTPRIVARDMGYEEYYVNCSHTRMSFIEAGVPESRVKLIESSVDLVPTPLTGMVLTRIGVSVNDLDDLADVEQVVMLLGRLQRTCILRVHDSDKRFHELKKLAARHSIELSNAAHSRITDFMREVDLVIAGNSNVVLDCLRAGMRVIYYWPGDPTLFDYYGIVTAARCEYATNMADLARKLGPTEGAATFPLNTNYSADKDIHARI